MSRPPCRSKQALLRGLRPSTSSSHTNQKIQCGVCPYRCIYCDIWKLATLITSHVSSFSSSNSSSPTRSPSSPSDPWARSSRALEAQFQTQRARLASIMSICTVDGAEECEGLRLAHDRCLGSVEELMRQQRVLREQSSSAYEYNYDYESRPSRGCGEQRRQDYYLDQQRPSVVGIAM